MRARRPTPPNEVTRHIELTDHLKKMMDTIANLSSRIDTQREILILVDDKIGLLENRVINLNNDVTVINMNMATLNDKIVQLGNKIEQLKTKIDELAARIPEPEP